MTAKRSKKQRQSAGTKNRQKVTVNDAESVMTQTILKVFRTQQYVCANYVHRRLEVPPDCMKFVAHVFRGLQFRKVIRIVKIVNTPRDGQNGNRIAIWELVPPIVAESAAVKRPRKPWGESGSNAATVTR